MQAKHFEQPQHMPSGSYAESLGQGANRFQRGHLVYQNMGHTAVFARVMGRRLLPCVGFFPKEGLLGSLSPSGFSAHGGESVTGAWHDDAWMFDDRAALAFEIPVSLDVARAVNSLLTNRLASPDTKFEYQIRHDPGAEDTASRNCVAAAIVMLHDIVEHCVTGSMPKEVAAREEIERVTSQMKSHLSARGYLQGQMQQLVQTGFTHLPD